MVLTWNAEPTDWPGIATAMAPAAAPACALTVDLPAIARGWYPLLAVMLVPPEQRALLPPQAVLVDHLPIWHLIWSATPDGCRIDERGLPLATLLSAAAAIRTVADADPEAETQRGLHNQQPAPAAAPQPPALF